MDSQSNDDEEARLMAAYCRGDRAAFDALYRLAAPRLLRYIAGFVGQQALAEDLLQQTFLKIHHHRAAYIDGARPMPWFYTIAHRTCLDELRRKKRSRVVAPSASQGNGEGDEGTGVPGLPAGELVAELDGIAPEARDLPAFDPALAQAAMVALADLPTGQREALLLTKVHGHSVAQAAAILGTTPGAVKVRSHRGYVALRKLLRIGNSQ